MRKLRQPNSAGFIADAATAGNAQTHEVADEPKKRRKKAEEVVADEPEVAVAEVASEPVEAPADAVVETAEEKPAEAESL